MTEKVVSKHCESELTHKHQLLSSPVDPFKRSNHNLKFVDQTINWITENNVTTRKMRHVAPSVHLLSATTNQLQQNHQLQCEQIVGEKFDLRRLKTTGS